MIVNGVSLSEKFDKEFLDRREHIGTMIREGIPKHKRLCKNLFYVGKRHLIAAERRGGKTLLMIGLSGWMFEEDYTVIYVDKENGSDEVARRYQNLSISVDKIDTHLRYYAYPRLPLELADDFVAYVESEGPKVVVIFDNQRGVLADSGLRENSSDDLAEFASLYTVELSRIGATCFMLDNTGWDKDHVRGSSAKEDYAEVVYTLETTQQFNQSTRGCLALKTMNSRFGDALSRVEFRVGNGYFEEISRTASVEDNSDDTAQRSRIREDIPRKIMEHADERGEVSRRTIVKGTPGGEKMVGSVLDDMASMPFLSGVAMRVEKHGKQEQYRYRLVNKEDEQ